MKLSIFFKKNNCEFELMHCVSTYPMRDEDANLKVIDTLKKKDTIAKWVIQVMKAHY